MVSKTLAELEEALAKQKIDSDAQILHLTKKLDALLSALADYTSGSAEILLLYDNLKSAFKVLGWVEKGASWVIKISAFCGTIWVIWKFAVIEAMDKGVK